MRTRDIGFVVIAVVALMTILNEPIFGQRNYPPKMKGAAEEVYKRVDGIELKIYRFDPVDHSPKKEKRAAIVFFFGGGWRSGNPQQFEQHCRLLAERGMVAFTADYRVSSRHKTLAKECVADGKSAIRWVRTNADRLGVDPNRIVAGGGSAGGHVAACAGIIKAFESKSEDLNVTSRPDAMVLFNPAVVLAPIAGITLDKEKLATLTTRIGVDSRALSPFHHVEHDVPPTLIVHGKDDTTVLYRTVELFADKINAKQGKCVLVGYEGQSHGFFNHGRSGNKMYEATTNEMVKFLSEQGMFAATPTKK
jgi:acetyl esterase/lipase